MNSSTWPAGEHDAAAARRRRLAAQDRNALADHDSFAQQRIDRWAREFGIFLCKRAARLQHDDLAAQAPERLRHFKPDRPRADDGEPRRQDVEIEQRFVGEISRQLDARDRRRGGRRARRDDEAARANFDAARFERVGPRELARRADNPHAERLEARLAVIGRDGVNDGAHMLAHVRHLEPRFVIVQPEARRLAHGLRGARGGDQRLRGNAAVVQAIAAHLALFDEHDLHAHRCGGGGDGKPARSGADHAQVRTQCFRHRMFPLAQAA